VPGAASCTNSPDPGRRAAPAQDLHPAPRHHDAPEPLPGTARRRPRQILKARRSPRTESPHRCARRGRERRFPVSWERRSFKVAPPPPGPAPRPPSPAPRPPRAAPRPPGPAPAQPRAAPAPRRLAPAAPRGCGRSDPGVSRRARYSLSEILARRDNPKRLPPRAAPRRPAPPRAAPRRPAPPRAAPRRPAPPRAAPRRPAPPRAAPPRAAPRRPAPRRAAPPRAAPRRAAPRRPAPRRAAPRRPAPAALPWSRRPGCLTPGEILARRDNRCGCEGAPSRGHRRPAGAGLVVLGRARPAAGVGAVGAARSPGSPGTFPTRTVKAAEGKRSARVSE
jgi:hypothetical protein